MPATHAAAPPPPHINAAGGVAAPFVRPLRAVPATWARAAAEACAPDATGLDGEARAARYVARKAAAALHGGVDDVGARERLREQLARQQLELGSLYEAELRRAAAAARPADFRPTAVTHSKIRSILRAVDPAGSAGSVAADVPTALAKASELFVKELTVRAWEVARARRRRSLLRSDVAFAVAKADVLDFLVDIVPPDCDETAGKRVRPEVADPTRAMREDDMRELWRHRVALAAAGDTREPDYGDPSNLHTTLNARLALHQGAVEEEQARRAAEAGEDIIAEQEAAAAPKYGGGRVPRGGSSVGSPQGRVA